VLAALEYTLELTAISRWEGKLHVVFWGPGGPFLCRPRLFLHLVLIVILPRGKGKRGEND